MTSTSLAFFLVAMAGDVGAMCSPTSLEEAVHYSDLIFAGSVTRAENLPVGGMVYTKYYFADIRYAKGSGPDSGLSLTQGGGFIGNHQVIESIDEAQFVVGKRYIVFADYLTQGLHSMYCEWSHPMNVLADTANAAPIVATIGGVVAFVDRHHVVCVRGRPWAPSQGTIRIDAHGNVVPETAPPRRTLAEELRFADSTSAAALAGEERSWTPGYGWSRDQIRVIGLWPHQDPHTRVTEDQMLAALAAVAARQASVLADSTRTGAIGWNRERLDPKVAELVHLSSAEVPPFPHEDPALMNPRKWPSTMRVAGRTCSLWVRTGNGGIRYVRSLDDADSGRPFSLLYAAGSRGSRPDSGAVEGPWYVWLPDGRLNSRSWTDSDSLRSRSLEYDYRPTGELYRYIMRREERPATLGGNQAGPSEEYEEIFGRDGTLLGLEFRRWGFDGSPALWCYWLGQPVDRRTYHGSSVAEQRRAFESLTKFR